jgi:hypothetical protein
MPAPRRNRASMPIPWRLRSLSGWNCMPATCKCAWRCRHPPSPRRRRSHALTVQAVRQRSPASTARRVVARGLPGLIGTGHGRPQCRRASHRRRLAVHRASGARDRPGRRRTSANDCMPQADPQQRQMPRRAKVRMASRDTPAVARPSPDPGEITMASAASPSGDGVARRRRRCARTSTPVTGDLGHQILHQVVGEAES